MNLFAAFQSEVFRPLVTPLITGAFGSSYSEEPGVEILYHGKARLWNEPVLGWLR